MNTVYEELLTEVRALRQENAELKEKTRALEEKLKLNSKNSSKPPSTDQKASNDIPKNKGGGKPGHPGHYRPFFLSPKSMSS